MKICYKNIGIILIHGLGGGLSDVEPLSKKLKMLGYTVETPLLRGHTGIKEDMKKVTYQDWINDVENAYLSLKDKCQEIVLIGYSMGGLLSLQVANKFRVKGLITLNTSMFLGNFFNFSKRFIKDLIQFNIYHIKMLYTSIRKLSLKAHLNLKRLSKETKKIIPNINCEILVSQSVSDEVLQYKSVNYLHKNVPCKIKKILFYNKNEVIEDVIVDTVKYIEICS
ncbi:alpha/beta fold hydrolase [Mycoplasmatota bacterium]|nr:alpha/beta fold hydrolase [Mycoplasmatota bacterium]